jgi:hypothetical protein
MVNDFSAIRTRGRLLVPYVLAVKEPVALDNLISEKLHSV